MPQARTDTVFALYKRTSIEQLLVGLRGPSKDVH